MPSHRSCGDGGGASASFHHQSRHRHPVKQHQEILRVDKKDLILTIQRLLQLYKAQCLSANILKLLFMPGQKKNSKQVQAKMRTVQENRGNIGPPLKVLAHFLQLKCTVMAFTQEGNAYVEKTDFQL